MLVQRAREQHQHHHHQHRHKQHQHQQRQEQEQQQQQQQHTTGVSMKEEELRALSSVLAAPVLDAWVAYVRGQIMELEA